MLVPEESAAGVGLCLPLGFGGEDADALEIFRLCQSQNFNRGWFSLTLSHHFSSTTGAFRVFSVFLLKSQPLAGRAGKKGWVLAASQQFPCEKPVVGGSSAVPCPKKSLCPGFMEAELGFAGLRIPWLCYTNC